MSKQNLTRIVGIWWVIVLLLMVTISMAQDIHLEPDSPVMIRLGDAPAWLSYEGKAGEIITISTLTAITDTAPDTTLEILYPEGHRLDYVDDVILADGTIKSDALLDNLTLPIDGLYLIRLDSFNGVSEGEIEVVLSHPSLAFSEIKTEGFIVVSGDVPALGSLQYTLEVSTDTTLSILARDVSGTLDPILRVYDADGTLIAFNDDHQSSDLSLDILDAAIMNLAISEDTILEIRVSDYLGKIGSIELIISS